MNNDVNNSELETINLTDQPGSFPHPDPQPIMAQPPQPAQPPQLPPKKSKKGLVLLLIVLGLLLVGAAVAVYIFFLQPKVDQENNTAQVPGNETTLPADTTDYAKVLIDKVQNAEKALVAKHPSIKVENPEASAPAYKAESSDYYVTGTFGYSLVASETAVSETTTTADFIKSSTNAATTALSSDPSLSKNETESTTTYKSEFVICTVSRNTTPLYVSCANTREYTAVTNELKPFASALFVAQGDKAKANTVLSTPKITKKADGYASAQVSVGVYEGVGGYAALFYGKDNAWIFWKGTQSQISCSEYDTFALQTSFLGDSCYDEATKADSTVKVQ